MAIVFQFLGGDDVAKALMASKHKNPWKMELVDGNEQQCIVSALKDRMMATENGKELLQKYYSNRPEFLPKLLYCMDHGYGIRYDGIYQCDDGIGASTNDLTFHYFRFYPTGEIISVFSSDTPAQIRRWFHKDNNGDRILKETFECNFIPTGQTLFQMTWRYDLVKTLSIGQNGKFVVTENFVGWGQSASQAYTFVKL